LIRHVGARRLSAEVVLARHPEVFVRALEPAEAQQRMAVALEPRPTGYVESFADRLEGDGR